MVTVHVKGPDAFYPFIGYIDSGADLSLVPRSFGNLLGFDLSKNLFEIRGIGPSKTRVSVQNARMKISGKEFDYPLAVALTDRVPYVVGRRDIFKVYSITFREKLQIIRFTPEA